MSSARCPRYSCQGGKILVGKPYAPQTLRVLLYSVGIGKTANRDRRVRLRHMLLPIQKSLRRLVVCIGLFLGHQHK